jgi:hypothetical protein
MADVLEQFLGGGKTTTPSAPSAPSVITDQILDRLKMVESSGDPYALNKESKAMGAYQFMPEQVQTMHKQGIEFNPFNEKESRAAAKSYLEKLVKEKGSVEKALAAYGGFITKDPTAYVNKVLQAPKTQATTQAISADPLEAFLSGQKPQPTAKPTAQPTTEPTVAAPVQQPNANQVPAEQPKANAVSGVVNRLFGQVPSVGQVFGQFQEGKRALGERVAGAADVLYSPVPAVYGAGVQALARLANTPQEAERIGQQAAATIDKPLGKAFGITGKETYQQPLGGITEPVAKEVNRMFNVLGMTPEQISEKTGIPPQDIKNMVVIGSVALPQALKETAPAAKQVTQAVTKPIREAAGELQVQRPGATTAEAQAQFQAMQAKPGSVGAAASENNPYAGKFTGEELGGSETFPQIKLTKITKDVPVPEQQLRSQLFQEVLPGVQPRPGVVTGNDNLLRNEHALASMAEPTPLGLKMKEQIANEQIGLSKYAEDRVNATGASKSLINDEQRGERINDVFHGKSPEDMSNASLMGYLNQAKQTIYNSAREKFGDNRINSSNIDNFFKDPVELSTAKAAGTSNVVEAAKELVELAKTVGFKLKDGTVAPPGSVAAYDYVRKRMNSPQVWSREKAGTISDINSALDRDIAAVADPALYKLGDNIHKLEKDLFKSKGIDKIFGEVDKNGVVTSATPLEKIPTKLNNMPKDQWRHIRDTLNELANGRVRNAPEGMPPVPPELRQSAKAAVAEIDGALAREVYKAGANNVGEWSSKKANNVMNSVVGQKIVETFPPTEVQNFHKLNLVGQYTPPLKYEGAALQQRRVGLLEKGLPGMGASAGAAVAGFLGEGNPLAIGGGAYVGREVGAKLQAGKAARAEANALKKMEKEQKKAAELGKQSGQNKLSDLGK